jgi:hypothetical protein
LPAFSKTELTQITAFTLSCIPSRFSLENTADLARIPMTGGVLRGVTGIWWRLWLRSLASFLLGHPLVDKLAFTVVRIVE